MAEAPTCKLCGKAHWSNEPHVFADEVAPRAAAVQKQRQEQSAQHSRILEQAAAMEPIPAPVVKESVSFAPPVDKDAEIARLRARIAELEGAKPNRKAYMRDYMKKRRAKGKG